MKDIKAATMVIAQKSQANDELGNDLVQANRLIVNFNNQHEAVTQEVCFLSCKFIFEVSIYFSSFKMVQFYHVGIN